MLANYKQKLWYRYILCADIRISFTYSMKAGWPRGTHTRTHAHTPLKLSSLGLNLNPNINCHPSVSQAFVCAVPRMDVKLGVPSGMSFWMSNISRCPSRRVGERSPASQTNSKFLPVLLLRRQWLTTLYSRTLSKKLQQQHRCSATEYVWSTSQSEYLNKWIVLDLFIC